MLLAYWLRLLRHLVLLDLTLPLSPATKRHPCDKKIMGRQFFMILDLYLSVTHDGRCRVIIFLIHTTYLGTIDMNMVQHQHDTSTKILEFHRDGIYFHEFLSVGNVPEGTYSSVASNILIDFWGVCWSKRAYVGS